MAKAEVTVAPIERTIVAHETRYILTLTRDEAQALLDICYAISGDPNKRRGLFTDNDDSIQEVLITAGLRHTENSVGGEIWFRGENVWRDNPDQATRDLLRA